MFSFIRFFRSFAPEFKILDCQNPEFKMDEASANDQGNFTQSSSSFTQHRLTSELGKSI